MFVGSRPLAALLLTLLAGSLLASCQRRPPSAPAVRRASLAAPPIQVDEASSRPAEVVRLGFAGADYGGWKLDGEPDEVLVYDGSLFFRGPNPTASARRAVTLEADQIDRVRVRARSLGGARMVIGWTASDGASRASAHRAFTLPGDDAWHDVDLDLANATSWRNRITNVSVGVVERHGLLRVEAVSFLRTSVAARVAAIDSAQGSSISVDDQRRRARPLFGSRTLEVSVDGHEADGTLSLAIGVPTRTIAHRTEPLAIRVRTGASERSISIPPRAGWHELAFDLDGEGPIELSLDDATRAIDDVVYVTTPFVVPVARDRRKNVLLVTCDTLRRGFLGCYGDTVTRTPTLDRLANDGITFDDATTSANSTNPSHTSIMTSLYPKDHGVISNADRLAEEAITLAEWIGSRGYATAAAVGSAVLNPLVVGIDQGFDAFFESREPKRPASEVNAAATPWIEAHRMQPFFLWVHYYDPHVPYRPPAEDLALYYDGDPREARRDAPALPADLPQDGPYAFLQGVADPEYPIALYRGEITSMDRELGRLLAELDRLGIRDDTIVVFTADHGESLGEHGLYYTHEGLYFTTVRAPWLMRVPGGPSGLRVRRPCETIDIAPTILALLGLEVPQVMRGRPQSLDDSIPPGPPRKQYFQHAHDVSAGIRTDRVHGILESPGDDANGRLRLFDVQSDPLMRTDVSRERAELASQLMRHLDEWLADRRELSSVAAELTPEQQQVLEQLGYTGK